MAGRQKSGKGGTLAVAVLLALIGAWAHDEGHLDALTLPSASASSDPGKHVHPVPGAEFTSGYGARWGTTHGGVDLAAATGTPIRAVAAGEVIEAGPASGFGLWLRLEHGNGDVTVYGHMHRLVAEQGEQVEAGEKIATVGSRGQSTGPHLHLEVWPGGDRGARVDPQPWLAKRGVNIG